MPWIVYAIIAAIVIAVLIIVARLIAAYRKAPGTPWQRFMLVFRNSETILWARLQVMSGFFVTVGSVVVTFAQNPDVASYMHIIITDAKQWAIYGLSLMGLGAVTEAVRRHRTEPAADGTIVPPPPLPKN